MAELGLWVPGFGTSSLWHEAPPHVYDAVMRPAARITGLGSWVCDGSEGWGPMSPTRDFDLTPCFQAAILWFLPAALFILAAVHALRRWSQCEVQERSENSMHVLHEKDGVMTAVTLLAFVEFVVLIGMRSHLAPAQASLTGGIQILASGTMLIAYVLAAWLQHTMHMKARHGSDEALVLWLLHLLIGPVRVRTILQVAPKSTLVQMLVVVPLCMRLLFLLAALFLECSDVEMGDPIASPDDDDDLEAEAEPEEEPDEFAHKASPIEKANLFSRLSFHWMQPLMSLGARKFLRQSDMWSLPKSEEAEQLGHAFQYHWTKHAHRSLERGRPLESTGKLRFWQTLYYAFGAPFALAAIFKVVQDVMAFVQPQILRALLAFVQTWEWAPTDALRGTPLRGFVMVALLFITSAIQTLSLHQYFQLVSVAGMRARAGVVTAIFRKSLRLSNKSRSEQSSGDIVNLMSVDANRLPDFLMYAHILWSAVFQIVIAFVSLFDLLGWSAFVGVAIMLVSVPVNTVLATYLRQQSAVQMKVRDRRTGLMNEIILNIKSIKLFAWEEAFTRRLLSVRNGEELPLLRNIGVASAGFNFFWQAIPFFVSLGTFIAYSATSSQPLTADIVFPALSLYQLLNFPLSMLAGIVSMFLQTQVSAGRLAAFFDSEELDNRGRRHTPTPAPPGGDVVRFRKASYAWSTEQLSPTLHELDLTVHSGELLAVLGRVGDGKSSLLSAILGDMVNVHGRLSVHGQVAFFVQGGWCMGATVRDNILFGRAYDEALYRQCLYACALEPDLLVLQHGDLTEIGERGVSLSGGQRARVALARACYAMADIYLLDDPLAAVDAHVGAHLWEHVIGPRGMLRTKTRILTLNAVSYLPQCDKIVTLRKGALLEERGTFEEVMAMKGEVYRVISSLKKSESQEQQEEAQAELKKDKVQATEHASRPRPRELSLQELKATTMRHLRESKSPQEIQETGSVKWSVYKDYIQSASSVGVALFFVAHILTQACTIARDVVLKQWSAVNARPDTNLDKAASYYLTLYGSMGMLTSVGVCIAPMILYVWLVLSSAKRYHDSLFSSLLRYPLQWFETTPTGRLLNLFSRDISVIDEVLPRVIQGMARSSVVVMGVVCVVTYSVPAFLVAIIPLAMAYRAVMRYYLSSSRELKRIDAVSKSPIFTWFQEALGGLSTIRAFSQASGFTHAFETRVDLNQMCYFPAVTCNRWLAVRIEFLGSFVILFASTMAIIVVTTGGRMSAGLLGLMLSQVLSTTQTLNWAVRSASEVEQNIVSVERVMSYAGLPMEREAHIPETQPPPSWPSRGVVEFRHYSTQYRPDLEPVLRDVSFKTRAGERIGVVGRTGAGKSTLTLALFRILEATEGSVYIDDIDISTLGLQDLRQSMAIIPQDAQLWQGTLRQNLDPLHQYTDSELYRVLKQARLCGIVDDHAAGLLQPVSEGGSNLSAGQRQLICIARAMVRQSHILVLDEATSSIDLETDQLVQQIVRTGFTGTTITIAHRLNTIMDSDRVLVLEQGRVAEFDAPATLLKNPQSQFYSMAREAGLVQAPPV